MKQLIYHWQSFKYAWETIFRHPLEHLINILVLALIITLCGLSLSIHNNLYIWQEHNVVYPQIMLYLDKDANPDNINNIDKALHKINKSIIRDYHFISKTQGLAELKQDQKLKEIASDIVDEKNNPLPDVFVINASTAESAELHRLNLRLSQLPKVNEVQIDLSYAGKIKSLINFANKVGIFSQMLFIIVLGLVVYNMVRLQMLLKSHAILVSRLLGASDSFIMRPLMHYVLWQITMAAIIAGLGLHYFTNSLNNLFAHFDNLFGKNLVLAQLSLAELSAMWLIIVIFATFTIFLAVRWVFKHTYAR